MEPGVLTPEDLQPLVDAVTLVVSVGTAAFFWPVMVKGYRWLRSVL